MKTVEIRFDGEDNYFIREAFNTLRTNVLFCGADVKKIVITSINANEGKTTVSLGIAKSLAEAERRVLLIDADLRKSVAVGRYTELAGVTGLSQLISGQASLADSVYHTQVTGLDVIFAGPFPPNPTELVGSETFRKLLEAVGPHYDYIILDAPPLGMVVDAAVIAGFCDGAILVLHQGKTKYRLAQSVVAQIEKSGCRVLGAVLNQPVSRRRSKSGGKYVYQYKSPTEPNRK